MTSTKSKLKQTEIALRESEEKFGAVFHNAGIGMAIVGLDGRIVDSNSALREMLGFSENQLKGMTFTELTHPDDVQLDRRYARDLFSGRRDVYRMDKRYICKNRNVIWGRLTASLVRDADGSPKFGIGMVEDISARKRTETELEVSKERYRLLADNTLDVIWTMDLDLKFTYVNPAIRTLTGYAPEQWLGTRLPDHCDEENFTKMAEVITTEIGAGPEGTGVIFEAVMLNKNREPIPVEIHGKVIFDDNGRPIRLQGTTREIYRRKLAEQRLQRSEALLATAQRIGKIGGWEWDVERQTMFWTEETYRIHDLDPDRARSDGTNLIDLSLACYSEEDRPAIREAYQKCVEKGDSYELECRFTTIEGRKRWIRTAGKPVLEANRVVRVVGNIQDITKDKHTEERLRNQNRFIQTILDNLPIGLAVNHLEDGSTTYINRRFAEIYGWPAEELTDIRTFFEKVYPDPHVRREMQGRIMADIESGDPERMYWENIEVTGQDGRKHIVSAKNIPLFEQNMMISTVQDVTERKRLEAQLHESQKMESIGNLAGGIAHDFNNILWPIVGMAELLLEDLPRKTQEYENAREILRAGKRGTDLVKQILALSRRSEHKMMPVRIQHVLKEALKLSRSTIPVNIRIAQDVQEDCGLVMADPSQLHQVMMNLITNAFHAVEETEGLISVQLKEIDLQSTDPGADTLQSGRYARLRVADTGSGIDPAVRDKIFEPYVTTKDQGRGTGLGLAVVYGIIKEHRGEIRFQSEPGKGAVFEIYLPLLDTASETVSFEAAHEEETGSEHILLVDDEEPIVRLEKQMLERLGYRVTAHVSSRELLKQFKTDPNAFDLVITDMTMPSLTGDQLAVELMAIRPDIPVVICTGFNERLNEENARAMGIRGFLMKPVLKSDLAGLIRNILDETRGASQ